MSISIALSCEEALSKTLAEIGVVILLGLSVWMGAIVRFVGGGVLYDYRNGH